MARSALRRTQAVRLAIRTGCIPGQNVTWSEFCVLVRMAARVRVTPEGFPRGWGNASIINSARTIRGGPATLCERCKTEIALANALDAEPDEPAAARASRRGRAPDAPPGRVGALRGALRRTRAPAERRLPEKGNRRVGSRKNWLKTLEETDEVTIHIPLRSISARNLLLILRSRGLKKEAVILRHLHRFRGNEGCNPSGGNDDCLIEAEAVLGTAIKQIGDAQGAESEIFFQTAEDLHDEFASLLVSESDEENDEPRAMELLEKAIDESEIAAKYTIMKFRLHGGPEGVEDPCDLTSSVNENTRNERGTFAWRAGFLADVYEKTKDVEKGKVNYERALQCRYSLVSSDEHRPNEVNAKARRDLAVSLRRIGWFETTMGDKSKGITYYNTCVDTILRIDTRTSEDNFSLGKCYTGLGFALRRSGEYKKAGDAYRKARESFGQATAAGGSVVGDWREDWRVASTGLAAVITLDGEATEEARREAREASEDAAAVSRQKVGDARQAVKMDPIADVTQKLMRDSHGLSFR